MDRFRSNARQLGFALLIIGRRYGLWIVLFLSLIFCLTSRYQLALNVTHSLPQTLFLIEKNNHTVTRGDYMAFRWVKGGPIPNDIVVIKEVVGVAGDRVEHRQMKDGLWVEINGKAISLIKPFARNGAVLVPGITGAIPEKHYFVHAPHPDSLDSRYALTGFVNHAQIVGRAIPLF